MALILLRPVLAASEVWWNQGILKGESGLFLPRVNAMGRRPYWPSRIEVSYCTFGFGAIIRRSLRTFSLSRNPLCDNLYVCVIKVRARKTTHAQQNCLAALAMKKIQRYNNSPPYVTVRWPPQQIPPLNFLGWSLVYLSLFCLIMSRLYLCNGTFEHLMRIPFELLSDRWQGLIIKLFYHCKM